MQRTTNEGDDQAVLDGSALRRRLTGAEPAERAEILIETVREQAATVLDQPAFTSDTNFLENGLTSLRALELTHRLTTLTGIEIPLVAVIEQPTPAGLGTYMADMPSDGA